MFTHPEEIAAAVARLRAGGVVAFPTETVYGLGADALDERAVARVFELKGRPSNNPLIVHVTGIEMARRVVAEGAWSREAGMAAKAFWPGPLSIVLAKADVVPAIVTGGGGNVGVRCPDHPTTLALLEAFGGPLVGPSANVSGRVSPTTAEHVRGAFSEERVLVLDGGACVGGIESTVLSLVDAMKPRILRPGLVGAGEIARVIGRDVQEAAGGGESGVVGTTVGTAAAPFESPGQMESHYAPVSRAELFDAADLGRVLGSGRAGLIVFVVWSDVSLRIASPNRAIRLPDEAGGYAAGIYAALREADAHKPGLIAIERPPEGRDERERGVWLAVLDRLRRACAARG